MFPTRQAETLCRVGRTTKLTALPGAETNLKHTDSMATKTKSKTPSAPAVDRAAPLFATVELEELILLASVSFRMLEAFLGPQWFEACACLDLVGPDTINDTSARISAARACERHSGTP